MNKQNSQFTQAYLKSINVIKEDTDKEDELTNECGDIETECGDSEVTEYGDKCCKKDEEVVLEKENKDLTELESTEKDDDIEVDIEDDDAEEAETDDEDGEEESDELEDKEGELDLEEEGTCFCFKTTNKSLIDAMKSGFDKAVFTVKAKDDEGNDTTTDVEFTADDFVDFDECDCDEGLDEEDTSDDDSEADDVLIDEIDLDDDTEELDEDEAFEANSFESVFNHYYKPLVSEATDYSGDLKIKLIKDWKEMEEIKAKYLRPKQIPWSVVKNEEEFNKMKKYGPIKLAFAGNKLYAAGMQYDKDEPTRWYNKQDWRITDDDRLK